MHEYDNRMAIFDCDTMNIKYTTPLPDMRTFFSLASFFNDHFVCTFGGQIIVDEQAVVSDDILCAEVLYDIDIPYGPINETDTGDHDGITDVEIPPKDEEGKKKLFFWLWILAAILVTVLLVVISTLLYKMRKDKKEKAMMNEMNPAVTIINGTRTYIFIDTYIYIIYKPK